MNLDIYTESMAKSNWDKAFFMDKIGDTKCIIDFGCADGAMIRMLAPLFPSITFIGYDSNKDLIDRAKEKTSCSNIIFWHKSEFWPMLAYVQDHWGKRSDYITVNFSSVLHEVFSETEKDSIDTVRTLITELKPKYITVRDMYFHVKYPEDNHLSELTKIHILHSETTKAPGKYNQFQSVFGPIRSWKDLLHFLMKFQWRDNGYEQELKENYFSWNIQDLLSVVGDYNVIFETHYLLPYYWEQWHCSPDIHTHAQFILRRMD